MKRESVRYTEREGGGDGCDFRVRSEGPAENDRVRNEGRRRENPVIACLDLDRILIGIPNWVGVGEGEEKTGGWVK